MRMLRAMCPGCGREVSVKLDPSGDGTGFRTLKHLDSLTDKWHTRKVPYSKVVVPRD